MTKIYVNFWREVVWKIHRQKCCNSLQCRCLISASKPYKLAIVYPPVMFDLKLEWVVGAGGRGRGRAKRCLPKDTTSKPPSPPPLVQVYFPLKAKMVALIFCQENTELLLTKITPAPQDSVVKEYMRPHWSPQGGELKGCWGWNQRNTLKKNLCGRVSETFLKT